jgi:hypothetical protein
MSSEQLAVRVTVSDPWEFVDSSGVNVFDASVQRTASESRQPRFPLLLELSHPVKSTAAEATRLFVAETHEPSDDYARLVAGHSVECRLTGVPEEQATSTEPLDVTGWRGRFPAARAQMQLA